MSNVRRLMSLSHQHPEHGCTDLLRYSTSSQKLSRSSPSFIRLTKRCQTHVGVSEFLSPLTRGQTGISPVESAQSSISKLEIGPFYCIFLCKLLGNRAHIVEILYIRIGVLRRDGRLDCAGNQLKIAVSQRLFGVHRQRLDDHIFKAHRRAYSGRSSGIVLLMLIPSVHPWECSS